jgi:hypothetical protein
MMKCALLRRFAIAQADVTKHAREIPIVRRIGIASYPSRWAIASLRAKE